MNQLFLNGQAIGAREGTSYTFLKENAFEKIKALEPEIILVFAGEFDPHHYKVWEHYLANSTLRSCIVCYSYKSYYHAQSSNHLKTSVPLFSEETGFNINDLGYIDSLKAVLYPANISRNWMYFYTLPKTDHTNKNIKHIHIGHGDSDKSSSSTRVQKIYDHSLVADESAIIRYEKNNIHLPEDHFLIMGVPVFPDIKFEQEINDISEILYIPTFEGPTEIMNYSSLSFLHKIFSKEIESQKLKISYHPHPAMGLREKDYKTISDDLLKKSNQSSLTKTQKFNNSSAAICDISGVTSEYLFTGKPIIIPIKKSNSVTTISPDLRKISYLWDFENVPLRNFISNIKGDPLRKSRMEFRNKKYKSATSFDQSVANFDAAIRSVFSTP